MTKEPISKESMQDALENKAALTAISSVLAHWENMALAIKLNIVNDEVAFEMTGTILVYYAYKFEEFIKFRRNEQSHFKAYCYLEDLSDRWKKELQVKNILLTPVSTPSRI